MRLLFYINRKDDMIEPEEDEAAAPDVQDYDSSSLHSGDISLLIYRLSEPDAHSFAPAQHMSRSLRRPSELAGLGEETHDASDYVHATPTGVHSESERSHHPAINL